MHELVGSLLDNDSKFGQLMTRLGIIIGANVMFVVFSLPIITAGPAFVALYTVMLKTLHGDGVLNPFKEYWKGFRSNFKQGMILWIVALILAFFFYVDFRIVMHANGTIHMFCYPLAGLALILIALLIYTFYSMAAFADTIPHLMRNGFYFMLKNPFGIFAILFFNVFSMYLTYSDPQMMPLYGFIWVTFGFGAIAMIGAAILHPMMKPYLSSTENEDSYDYHEPTEEETLEMMRKLGM